MASSSAGNCYHITLNRKDLPPVVLLLEAGLPYAEILRRMSSEGLDLRPVDAVLIRTTTRIIPLLPTIYAAAGSVYTEIG